MTDPYLYLEEINSNEALNWVNHENSFTEDKFTKSKYFDEAYRDIEKVLLSAYSLPYIYKKREYVYNFWQDEKNIIGIWRRTTLEKYQQENTDWELLLDLDELSRNANHHWAFAGADFLENDVSHCMIYLSDQGSDSYQICEFDLQTKKFVEDGFFVDTAKANTCWINKNEIYVMTDFGEDSLTLSGYPRIVKRWKRGTPIDQAETVFSVENDDLQGVVYIDHLEGKAEHIFMRIKNFYENEFFLGEQKQRIDIPHNAFFSLHQNFMFLELKSDWHISVNYTSGSLLMIDFNSFLNGDRNFKVIAQSTPKKIMSSYALTKDYLILNIMKDVSNYLEVYKIGKNLELVDTIFADGIYSQISINSFEKENNEIVMTVESFIQPQTQYLINFENKQKIKLKTRKYILNPDDYRVEQNFATSKDGTQIPYFQISENKNFSSYQPVLIEGYGGYEISLQPRFLDKEMTSWINKGGVYVVANIRGGGEYGPNWHQQALKQYRHRSYEDFAAVAQDLIQRGVTVKEKLAAIGGSNGGLLMGNMLTQYADLFEAIVCEVPVLDMLRFHKIGAGYSWIAEYGDPENPDHAKFLRSISPYHLLDDQKNPSKKYPAVLFYTATSDDRVTPVHARKMAAKMKDKQIDDVYFYEQVEGGHSIFVNKKLTAFHTALVSSFLFDSLKLN